MAWHGMAPNDEQYARAIEELEKVGYSHLNVKIGATHAGISV